MDDNRWCLEHNLKRTIYAGFALNASLRNVYPDREVNGLPQERLADGAVRWAELMLEAEERLDSSRTKE